MNAFLKLAGLITKRLFTTKPLAKKLCDGAKFAIKEELKGKQTRSSFFGSIKGILNELA
jgi:hypothetical protein